MCVYVYVCVCVCECVFMCMYVCVCVVCVHMIKMNQLYGFTIYWYGVLVTASILPGI